MPDKYSHELTIILKNLNYSEQSYFFNLIMLYHFEILYCIYLGAACGSPYIVFISTSGM